MTENAPVMGAFFVLKSFTYDKKWMHYKTMESERKLKFPGEEGE